MAVNNIVSSLVIQGLLLELAARNDKITWLRAQLADSVADADSLRETLQAALARLRSTTQALNTTAAAVTALRREKERNTREQAPA